MKDIRIQDDLYEYVNHDWLETAVIPEDKPTTGGFATLAKDVEEKLLNDFAEMVKEDKYPDKYLENACRVYKLVLDVKRRHKDGIKPALKELNRIYKLKNVSALNRNLKEFVLDDLALPFAIGVEADMMDTTKHCVMIQGPSTILPDVTYYKEEAAQQRDMMLGLWSNMVKAILAQTKLTPEEQETYLANTLKFDSIIATLVKSSEEWSEYTKIYNPMKVGRVASLLKPIKFKKLLESLFGYVPETIIVADPRFLKGFSTLFNEENFELYKSWAYVISLLGCTSVLSEELRELGGMYRRALSGVAVMPSVEKYAYQLASSIYSEPVGLFYGRKYFGEEAKKDIIAMVKEIVAKYKVRIKKNEILSEPTKEKAILKLEKMAIHMGYPDKVDELYDKLVFEDGLNLLQVTMALSRIRREDNFAQLDKPVDRNKWIMPGHLVNAGYNPFTNDITFPAAILQPPFYSINQSKSENLGGIGSVIGHEISHAFDNNGARCDENGNLKNWWLKEDFKKFTKKTNEMIKEFDGIELPWGKVNGALIVSENIADNGGMAVTLDIMHDIKDSSFEEYFINWGKIWCMKAKPEYLQLILSIDVHAPAILRANMQPRNFPEWYETFNVSKKDKMYIAPNKRVVIW